MTTLTTDYGEATELLNTVIEGGYCIGCGACTAVADSPFSIELNQHGQYCARVKQPTTSVSNAKVLAVCPFASQALNEDEISNKIFGHGAHHDHHLGHYLATFAGYVKNSSFREHGSSGGMGKWIAYELFNQDLVDVVIQVEQITAEDRDQVLYRYCIVDSAEKILHGSKSAYYPVEMSKILQYVRKHPQRYAIVGLPCFIKTIRLLALQEAIFAERIIFCIGLVCGHLKSSRYADMLAWQQGILPGNLSSIDFRKKLPGASAKEKGIEVIGSGLQNTTLAQNLFGANYSAGFFMYKACDFCDDVVAETADITVGDAWLPAYTSDGKGTNIIVIRNQKLLSIVEKAASEGILQLDHISPQQVVQSQAGGFRHRREGLAYRLYLNKAAKIWSPPKRVEAKSNHISKRRKRMYEVRIRMARESHTIFQDAIDQKNFDIFYKKMNRLLKLNYRLSRPTPIGALKVKLKNFLERVMRLVRGV